MAVSKSEIITTAGGGLVLAALVFGAGLFLMGTKHAETEIPEAEPAKKDEKKDGKEKKEEKKEKAGEKEGTKEAKADKEEKEGAKKEGEGEEKKEGESKKKEGGHETAEEDKTPIKPAFGEIETEAEEFASKGDMAVARGHFDEAVEAYTRALRSEPADKVLPFLLLKLGDATLGLAQPSQARHEKALKHYARLVADFPESAPAEQGQFMAAECYRALGRVEEASDAYGQFARRFPDAPRANLARLHRAEALIMLDEAPEALVLLEALRKLDLPSEQKSQVLVLSAQARLKLARNGRLPEDRTKVKAEVIDLEDKHARDASLKIDFDDDAKVEGKEEAKAPTTQKPAAPKVASSVRTESNDLSAAVPPPPGVPDSQWAAIERSAYAGNLKEAHRLLSPWLTENEPADLVSQRLVAWGDLLRHLADNREKTSLRSVADAKEERAKP